MRHFAIQGGCSSKVEPQPSKLMMWVRFPSPAPLLVAGTHGQKGQAHIAQAVEHSLGKGEVTGSSPVVGTIIAIDLGINIFENLTEYFGDRHGQSKI